jgi:hypothetical protein
MKEDFCKWFFDKQLNCYSSKCGCPFFIGYMQIFFSKFCPYCGKKMKKPKSVQDNVDFCENKGA